MTTINSFKIGKITHHKSLMINILKFLDQSIILNYDQNGHILDWLNKLSKSSQQYMISHFKILDEQIPLFQVKSIKNSLDMFGNVQNIVWKSFIQYDDIKQYLLNSIGLNRIVLKTSYRGNRNVYIEIDNNADLLELVKLTDNSIMIEQSQDMDLNICKQIRRQLYVSNNSDEDITQSIINCEIFENMTNHLYIFNCGIISCKGLENMTHNLNLSNNKITSLEGLKNMVSHLDLSGNLLTQCKGIENMTNNLELSYNSIVLMKGLENMINNLYLENNNIVSLEGLNNMTYALHLYGNKITSCKGINKMIRNLDLSSNDIVSLEGLENMRSYVDLSNNQIISCKGLENMIDHLDLSSNQITDIQALKNMKSNLDLSGNQLQSLQDLFILQNMNHKLSIINNPVSNNDNSYGANDWKHHI